MLCGVVGRDISGAANAPALRLSETFRWGKAPQTGRTTIQLTWGRGFTYPLYFSSCSTYPTCHKAKELRRIC